MYLFRMNINNANVIHLACSNFKYFMRYIRNSWLIDTKKPIVLIKVPIG